MLNSIYFFCYLMAIVAVYWLLPGRKTKSVFLIISSFTFIGYYSPGSVVYLAGITLLTYAAGVLIDKGWHPVLLHRAGITILLLSLIVFKYIRQISEILEVVFANLNKGLLPVIEDLLIPLGISYIVFKYISYLTDIYWKVTKPGSIIDFFCYGSLFTIFFAGPIERFSRLKLQLDQPAAIDDTLMFSAYTRIIQGLFKKYVLVNWLYASIISKSITGCGVMEYLLYAATYSVYIYLDFSSYSDIAIGSSAFFGFKITENFNYPYSAVNITEFWRRWHISLSEWIRDYLFFPLSWISSRRLWLLLGVPLIAMAACGIWHGSGWKYLVWGLVHGALIGYYQMHGKRVAKSVFGKGILSQIAANALLLIYISAAWFFFYPVLPDAADKLGTGLVRLLLTGVVFAGVLFAGYYRKGWLFAGNLRMIHRIGDYPVLSHTVLLLVTLGLGLFNTDSTFVYVDF